MPDGLSTDTHHRTRTTMESRGLSIVLDRSHFACSAVLTQALQEAALGNGSGGPRAGEPRSCFFQRCQNLNWHFFANLYEAFLSWRCRRLSPVMRRLSIPCGSILKRSGSSTARAWPRQPAPAVAVGRPSASLAWLLDGLL